MKKTIKQFVKQTLGCKCPDEVFQYIGYEYNIRLNKEILLNSKINIGNRLLIYTIETNDADFIKNSLSAIVALGKEERDFKGFNRFRLVLACKKMEELKQTAYRIFKDLKNKDQKIHLHVVKKIELTNIKH